MADDGWIAGNQKSPAIDVVDRGHGLVFLVLHRRMSNTRHDTDR